MRCTFLLEQAVQEEKFETIKNIIQYMNVMVTGFNTTLGILIDLKGNFINCIFNRWKYMKIKKGIHDQLVKKMVPTKGTKDLSYTSDIEKIIERIEDLEALFGEDTIREFMVNIQNVISFSILNIYF